jgi:hypothetical protein
MSDEGDKREDIFLGDGWPMVRIIFRKGKRESNILRFPFVKYVLTVDFSTNVAVGTFSFYFLNIVRRRENVLSAIQSTRQTSSTRCDWSGSSRLVL